MVPVGLQHVSEIHDMPQLLQRFYKKFMGDNEAANKVEPLAPSTSTNDVLLKPLPVSKTPQPIAYSYRHKTRCRSTTTSDMPAQPSAQDTSSPEPRALMSSPLRQV
jgi:hypothetical protein